MVTREYFFEIGVGDRWNKGLKSSDCILKQSCWTSVIFQLNLHPAATTRSARICLDSENQIS